MLRLRLSIVVLVLGVFFLAAIGGSPTNAQGDPTPTPTGPISPQGGDNLGPLQLMTPAEVMERTNISAWHAAGFTGAGQRIGVLDQGFGGLMAFEQQAGASVQLQRGVDAAALSADSVVHGTNILWVLHTLAPGAEFYACQYFDLADFTSCIDWMVTSGVTIINHSAGVPALPLDGSSVWANEVNRAERSGVLWINAAGNFNGGYIQDSFTDRNTNTYHEFRGSGIIETLAINPVNQPNGRIMLSWEGSNDFPAEHIDFDLEIVDLTGNVIAASTGIQNGSPGQIPLEWVMVNMNQPFGIRVRNVDGNGVLVRFVLFVEFVSLPDSQPNGSIITPGDSLNALTVGALKGNNAAPYSSRGPLTTGVIKPDLMAPGELLLPNGQVFVGTSAAAPVVAAAAALVWQANPGWLRQDVHNYLLGATVDDNEFPDIDIVYGHGRLYMPEPDAIVTPVPTATATPVTLVPTVTLPPVTLVPDETPALVIRSFDPGASSEAGTSSGRVGSATNIDFRDNHLVIGNCVQGCGWWSLLDPTLQQDYRAHSYIVFDAYTSDPGGSVTLQIEFNLGEGVSVERFPVDVEDTGDWAEYRHVYALEDANGNPVNIDTFAIIVLSNPTNSTIHVDNIRLESGTPPPTDTPDTVSEALVIRSFDPGANHEAGTSSGALISAGISLADDHLTITGCTADPCGWWSFLDPGQQAEYHASDVVAFEAYTSDPGGRVAIEVQFKLGDSLVIARLPATIDNTGSWQTYHLPYDLLDAMGNSVNVDTFVITVFSNPTRSAIHIDNIRLEHSTE